MILGKEQKNKNYSQQHVYLSPSKAFIYKQIFFGEKITGQYFQVSCHSHKN